MGSALPPFQEGLWVVQAPLREGLPAYPTPGLGSALGGHHSESQYLPVWFYQFFTPAPRHFSLLPLAQTDFYAAPELASTVPKACQVLRGCFFGFICCYRPKAALPRSPSTTSGSLSAMVSGLCSCHSDKHKQPLFFLPPGGTGPGFPRGWPESMPGGLGHGAEPACGALFLLHRQQGMEQ